MNINIHENPYEEDFHDIWEVEEIRRNNISRRRIKRRNIHSSKIPSLQTQFFALCKNRLSEEYISYALDNFQAGYLYYDSVKEECIGVCLWKRTKAKQPTIELLLLCSRYSEKKLGHYMLNDVELYAHESKIKFITVHPADKDLVVYYESNGFMTVTSSKSEPKEMIKELTLFPIKKRNGKTRKRTFPRNNKYTQPLTATMMPINLNKRRSERFS